MLLCFHGLRLVFLLGSGSSSIFVLIYLLNNPNCILLGYLITPIVVDLSTKQPYYGVYRLI